MIRTWVLSSFTAAVLSLHGAGAPMAREDAAEPAAAQLSRDILFKVTADDGDADGHITAQLDIAAPPERVWSVMLDCELAPKYLTALKSCKVLEASADGLTDIREHRSRWLALLPETVSVFRSIYKPAREITFERVGGDFRVLKGHWLLQPLIGGQATRLSYEAHVGVDMPVPGFLIRSALEQDVPQFLSAFRAEVERTP